MTAMETIQDIQLELIRRSSFNNFNGQQITDSGADVVTFIKEYLTHRGLEHLIL